LFSEKQVFEFFVCYRSGTYSPNSLCVLIWNFYQTFLIVRTELWLRLKPQIHPTRFAINFYSSLSGPKGGFVFVWNCFIFFSKWNLFICFCWNLSRLVSNCVWISTQNFNVKLFEEKISKIFGTPRLSSFNICAILP